MDEFFYLKREVANHPITMKVQYIELGLTASNGECQLERDLTAFDVGD